MIRRRDWRGQHRLDHRAGLGQLPELHDCVPNHQHHADVRGSSRGGAARGRHGVGGHGDSLTAQAAPGLVLAALARDFAAAALLRARNHTRSAARCWRLLDANQCSSDLARRQTISLHRKDSGCILDQTSSITATQCWPATCLARCCPASMAMARYSIAGARNHGLAAAR